ncbi:aminoglycoside phosphotransferase family protein [Bacillus sp. UNCCL81]|uniref:aminoglycoside phosphotransferase family protein n=1 Tax=Bacillus sp. UNCCL81 TaxID=1502755 RepID=UPI0008F342FD|nr:aminoglycoside phosphotransferase family protein [Bacillus sp. UNCCL81]SFC84953.1 Predicted kinase, aminoglycoside phosphotransferase (APT) family [Bacillus sp. UNCCL81]
MVSINVELVKQLINEQFPIWSQLEIKPVELSGNDNRTFHLGDKMSVRLPSAECYVPQVEKEHKWLPILTNKLSLPVSKPLAKGSPSKSYPWPWTINEWIDGESLNKENISDLSQFAKELGQFLKEFQSIDAHGGPIAGKHNFFRGGNLAVYDQETKDSIDQTKAIFNKDLLTEIWETALSSKWEYEPVWVHGDIAPGNLLVKNGKLCAVIDFGILGVGDPSCDAVMAWTFFDTDSRNVFKNVLNFDENTWNRARGWALWKALITFNANKENTSSIREESFNTINVIMNDFKS